MKSYTKREPAGGADRRRPLPVPDTAAFGGLPDSLNQSSRVQAQLELDRFLNVRNEAVPAQRMYSGEDEHRASRKEEHKDVAKAKGQIQAAFGLDDSQYQFIRDGNDEILGGSGNCHGYSLNGNPDEHLSLTGPESFLDHYGDQEITVFTKGGEVAHSARRQGEACVHKVFVEGGWGPLIQASADSVAEAYDGRFDLPSQLDEFNQWAKLQQQQEAEQGYRSRVRNTFGYFLDEKRADLIGRFGESKVQEFLNLADDDPPSEGTMEKILAAMKEITGEDFETPQAFLDKYEIKD